MVRRRVGKRSHLDRLMGGDYATQPRALIGCSVERSAER